MYLGGSFAPRLLLKHVKGGEGFCRDTAQLANKGTRPFPGVGPGGWEGSGGAAPLPEAGGEDCTPETLLADTGMRRWWVGWGGVVGGVQPSVSGLSVQAETQPPAMPGRRPLEAPRRPRLEQALSVCVWKVQALPLSSPGTAMTWVPRACAWQLVRARGVGLHQEGQFSWEREASPGRDSRSTWRSRVSTSRSAPRADTHVGFGVSVRRLCSRVLPRTQTARGTCIYFAV